MDYPPNVEAVTAFARDVFPLIRKARPDTHFAIVGRNPADEVKRLGQGGNVIVTGAVADIRSWLAAADRSEEHTSELQSLMRNSYAVFCLKKKHTTSLH